MMPYSVMMAVGFINTPTRIYKECRDDMGILNTLIFTEKVNERKIKRKCSHPSLN